MHHYKYQVRTHSFSHKKYSVNRLCIYVIGASSLSPLQVSGATMASTSVSGTATFSSSATFNCATSFAGSFVHGTGPIRYCESLPHETAHVQMLRRSRRSPSSSYEYLDLDAVQRVQRNNDGIWSSAASSVFTIPITGVKAITGSLCYFNNNGGLTGLRLIGVATTQWRHTQWAITGWVASTTYDTLSISELLPLIAGDTVSIQTYQERSGNMGLGEKSWWANQMSLRYVGEV